ncbi:porin [Pantoea sp. LMR881]|uniref:porin n=1 Tax=Pantoea sp. LMR881 TaxID=3014336 RepID=UPI0022AEA697|nr:porin [Pantoea sp. LMR881]MCZ4060883.1 porin [Pantoea sp. LMR881]
MRKIILIAALMILSDNATSAMIYNNNGNKFDFYGSVRGRHYFSDNASQRGDFSYIRFGFKGQTIINDDITGYGQWEYQAQANKAESEGSGSDKTRLGFAGLSFKGWGSIDYGRGFGVYYTFASITDLAPIYDILTDAYMDGFMTGRANNLLSYRNKNLFGYAENVSLTLQYQGANGAGENNSRRSVYTANGEGYGANLEWDVTSDLALLAAYSSSHRTAEQNALTLGDGKLAQIWGAGIKYNPGAYYLAVKYSAGTNITPVNGFGYANKTQNFEVYTKYIFDNGIEPALGYFYSRGKDIEGYGNVDLLNYIDSSLRYFFNMNMSVYVDYRINLLDNATPFTILTDDTVGFGITYQF